MRKKEETFCEVCGVSSTIKRVNFIKIANMCLCEKHRDQFKRFGVFKDANPRGVFDLNEIRILDDYAEIDTYDQYGNVVETFILDVEDVNKLCDKKWRTVYKKDKPYLFTGNQNKERIYFHRLIMDNPTQQVDHISGNTLDNRKCNLRIVSFQDNMKNLLKKKDNTSGIRGVSFNKKKNSWKTDFTCNKIRYYVKEYNTIEEAVYQRYILEVYFLQDLRNTTNDEIYFQHINKLTQEQKNHIKEYIITKLNISKERVDKI